MVGVIDCGGVAQERGGVAYEYSEFVRVVAT